jgi:hypothetical protein
MIIGRDIIKVLTNRYSGNRFLHRNLGDVGEVITLDKQFLLFYYISALSWKGFAL